MKEEKKITLKPGADVVLYVTLMDIRSVLVDNGNFSETVAVIDEILTQVRGEA